MRLFREAFKDNQRTIIMMLATFFILAVLNLFPFIMLGQLINQGIMQANTSVILPFLLVLLTLSCSIGLFTLIRISLFAPFEVLMLHGIQSKIMKHVLKLPLPFFDAYTVGDLSHRVLLIEALARILSPNQLGIFLSFIFSFVSFGIMFFYAWQLTLLILSLVGVVLLLSTWSAIQLFPYLEAHATNLGETYGFMYQVISGITRIKLFIKESVVEKKWLAKYSTARHELLHAYRIGVWRFTLFSIVPALMTLVLFYLVVSWKDSLSPDHFIVYFAAFLQFIIGFVAFSMNANGFIQAMIAYKRVLPVLEAESEQTQNRGTATISFQEKGRILLKDIQFNYPGSNVPIFKSIDCTIPFGQHVAFVGLSGSGKSTLLKLLLGFYTPSAGEIYFGDKHITELDLSALRKQVGIVFQDSKLINGSILENIIGHRDATEADAWDVARRIGLDTFIRSLPMGMHTTVSQYMPLLSGGQKQLLLIAKALVGQPKLLLLDEATNSLDNSAQERVVKHINSLNITRISIAHRLSTVKDADKIMVLDRGSIVESGTFEELMELKGLFYQLALIMETTLNDV
jgi:ATP-binding cassette subfamily C protein